MATRQKMYCVHGLTREHVVSIGGTRCIGPFQWAMLKIEAESLAGYYREVERLIGAAG